MGDLSVLDVVGRLGVATLAGALIGFEREQHGHPAGMRTHALAALGATLFTIAGAYGFGDVRPATADPARVAAQVAAGIGFIGAGAVLRHGLAVRGLTTAATLWVTAALGVASGAGAYAAVGATTGLVLAVLLVSRLRLVVGASERGTVEIEYERGHGTLGPLLRTLQHHARAVDHVDIDDETTETRRVTIHVRANKFSGLEPMLDAI